MDTSRRPSLQGRLRIGAGAFHMHLRVAATAGGMLSIAALVGTILLTTAVVVKVSKP